jgi:hypothetical protein
MVSWGAGRLDIVVAGSDSKLYHKAYQDGSGWSPNQVGWNAMGGFIMPGANPTMVSWGVGRLDIFMRNSNFMIQHKAWDNQGGWYPGATLWEDLGKYIE